MNKRLSISTNIYADLSLEEAVEKLVQTPFKLFEMSSQHSKIWCRNDHDWVIVKHLKNTLDAKNARFTQIHAPIIKDFAEHSGFDAKFECYERAVLLASEFGARWLIVHPITKEGWFADRSIKEWIEELNIKVFRKLLKSAEKKGIGIAIENLKDSVALGGRRFGSIPLELQWILDRLHNENVGICWDTGHANLQFKDQSYAINSIKDRIVCTHINDNRGDDDDHIIPFRGSTDWSSVMKIVASLPVILNFEVGRERDESPVEVRNELLNYVYKLGEYFLKSIK